MQLRRTLGAVPLFFPLFCAAAPEARPEPEAVAEAEAQTYSNNAPFSGAIYIVSPDGQAVTAQSSNQCPSFASTSCGDISKPSWCCPSGYTCAAPANANGMVGCCPNGSTCGGTVNVASVSTVTVYGVQQTTAVYVQPTTTAVVYNQPATVTAAAPGFCQTLTMSGPDLPRVTQGACGTILIVNQGAQIRGAGAVFGSAITCLHFALRRIFP